VKDLNILYAFMGSKKRHLFSINNIIDKCNAKNYYELFLGSGIMLL
jgi:hypothetical protein